MQAIYNLFSTLDDENQQELLKDPLHVPVGPITRARSKKIKEALNGLIQDICADSTTGHNKLGPKEDEGIIESEYKEKREVCFFSKFFSELVNLSRILPCGVQPLYLRFMILS